MPANQERQRWSYAEFARLPDAARARQEVIAGELVVTPAPTSRHQEIVAYLTWRLYGFVREHGLGKVFPAPIDVLFGEGDYLEPDLVFVAAERLHLLSDRGMEGAPDLVVEVVSPSTAGRDRGLKLERYRRYGVHTYWVVDPADETVEVWDLAAGASLPIAQGKADMVWWTPRQSGPRLEIALRDLFA
jgi:Uma2 family endonuclease